MKKEGVIITRRKHRDIYNWLLESVYYYKDEYDYYTLTKDNKINVSDSVMIKPHVSQFNYQFGHVKGFFNCSNCYISSLIGSPEKVDGMINYSQCENLTSLIGHPKYIGDVIRFKSNRFSNNPSKKEEYKLYLVMWLELLESVSNEDRKEYIKNYKNKVDDVYNQPIIPIEIMKEYGF